MTPVQHKLRGFIGDFIALHGYSPSYQEIADGCGLAHRSKAHTPIKLLIADGWLSQQVGRQRSLQLSEPSVHRGAAMQVNMASTDTLIAELNRRGIRFDQITYPDGDL